MYPILLSGVLKSKIWGGHHLESFGKTKDNELIGESWEVSCHKNGKNIVTNGIYKGLNLCEVMDVEQDHLLSGQYKEFPLLVKFIDANAPLSVQVHPGDDYAQKNYNSQGKTEAWYIVSAEEGAEIILGTNEKDIDQLMGKLEVGDLTSLNHINVKAGEFYYVPSGTIHGIGKGVVILEIQQNSDITFRLFDYGRGREVHLKEGQENIELNTEAKRIIGIELKHAGYIMTKYIKNGNFTVEKIEVHSEYTESLQSHRFQIFTCISGQGKIIHDQGQEIISKGGSFLIPKDMGAFKIVGRCELIKSYIEDKNEEDK